MRASVVEVMALFNETDSKICVSVSNWSLHDRKCPKASRVGLFTRLPPTQHTYTLLARSLSLFFFKQSCTSQAYTLKIFMVIK